LVNPPKVNLLFQISSDDMLELGGDLRRGSKFSSIDR
jgi:hypothetical protein